MNSAKDCFLQDEYRPDDHAYVRTREELDPKEYFVETCGIISEQYGDRDISLIDVGCANGAFLSYANESLNISRSYGVDISEELLDIATKIVPESSFVKKSIFDLSAESVGKFDVCTCLGTVSLIDEFNLAIYSLLELIADEGLLIILDCINDFPIDTIMRFRRVTDQPDQDYWQPGFNVRSTATYESVLACAGEEFDIVFRDFNMPFSIEKTEDPMRAWTICTEESKHQLVLGTRNLIDMKFACIKRT